jgi:hypothetical protein
MRPDQMPVQPFQATESVDVLAAMRAASRHVPNEQFVEFDDAIGAVSTLIAAARAAAESLRHHGAHLHADRLMQAINGATP